MFGEECVCVCVPERDGATQPEYMMFGEQTIDKNNNNNMCAYELTTQENNIFFFVGTKQVDRAYAISGSRRAALAATRTHAISSSVCVT